MEPLPPEPLWLDLEQVLDSSKKSEESRPEGSGWGLILWVGGDRGGVMVDYINDLGKIRKVSEQIQAIRAYLLGTSRQVIAVLHVVRDSDRIRIYLDARGVRSGFRGRRSDQVRWVPIRPDRVPAYLPAPLVLN